MDSDEEDEDEEEKIVNISESLSSTSKKWIEYSHLHFLKNPKNSSKLDNFR